MKNAEGKEGWRATQAYPLHGMGGTHPPTDFWAVDDNTNTPPPAYANHQSIQKA